tara:strand:+ start:76 stop:600 length:525 start_codon:yes stop_codon:yes gene_type:complete
MKNLLLVLVLGLGLNSYSQTITQSEIGKMIKGVPFKKFTKYVDNNGTEYKTGDTLTINKGSLNNRFVYIGKTILMEQVPMDVSDIGYNIIIGKIKIGGNKRQGFKVQIVSKISDLHTYYSSLQLAIDSGEIIGKGYTSDNALSELKRAKDKLDLGLITQEEFNSKRLKLAKYIK